MPTAPGWHPDPSGNGGERWWDGNGWTEHVRQPASGSAGGPPPAAAGTPAPPAAPPPPAGGPTPGPAGDSTVVLGKPGPAATAPPAPMPPAGNPVPPPPPGASSPPTPGPGAPVGPLPGSPAAGGPPVGPPTPGAWSAAAPGGPGGPGAPGPLGGPGAPGGPAPAAKKKSKLPLLLGAVAVVVVLALVAVAALVLLGGDDPKATWDGDEIEEPEAVLTRGQAALDEVVDDRGGATVDSTRCYFVQPDEDESDIADHLLCGPVLFVDGDPDEPWLTFGLDRRTRQSPAELRVADTPDPADPVALPDDVTLYRPDDRQAPRDGDGIEAPQPPPAEAGLFRRDDPLDEVVEVQTPTGPGEIVTLGASYQLEGAATVERFGDGDSARRPADGEQFLVFDLSQGLGEGFSTDYDTVRVQVGDAEPVALPDVDDEYPLVDGRYLLSAPADEGVDLVVTTGDLTQRMSLVDGSRTDGGVASVLLRDDTDVTVEGGPQALSFTFSQGGQVSAVYSVDVNISSAELTYFFGTEGRVPEDPTGAWLVIDATFTWSSDVLALAPSLVGTLPGPPLWNIRTPGGRTIGSVNLATEDGKVLIGFPVPGDIVGGTFVVGGTESGSVTFDTGSNRVNFPFSIPE